jgi:hypothetical protein
MYNKFLLAAAVPLALLVLLTSCENTSDQVKKGYNGDDKTITYGQAFALAFQNGVWSETKDDQGEKIAQFTGKISTGLHAFALEKKNKSGDRVMFSSACSYLATLVRKGKVAGQPDITFNISDYPITKQGELNFNILDDYISSPDNKEKMNRLNAFYMNRYWEAGTECMIQWKLLARGKMFSVVKISNQHWDDDGVFTNKPENILPIVFNYAKSVNH